MNYTIFYEKEVIYVILNYVCKLVVLSGFIIFIYVLEDIWKYFL